MERERKTVFFGRLKSDTILLPLLNCTSSWAVPADGLRYEITFAGNWPTRARAGLTKPSPQ